MDQMLNKEQIKFATYMSLTEVPGLHPSQISLRTSGMKT